MSEPLNLRIRDVNLESMQFIIRAGKGGKDRTVAIPCSVLEEVREQMEAAWVIWERDRFSQVPLTLPHLLAVKYPYAEFDWNWAWLFPAKQPCVSARTDKLTRWRLHEANLQRTIRKAGRALGLAILPHELRHAYATHCLKRGANPRAIQEVMGHRSLETTMAYLHAETLSVPSPLDA